MSLGYRNQQVHRARLSVQGQYENHISVSRQKRAHVSKHHVFSSVSAGLSLTEPTRSTSKQKTLSPVAPAWLSR